MEEIPKHKRQPSDVEFASGEYCDGIPEVRDSIDVGLGRIGPVIDNIYFCRKHQTDWRERLPQ